MSKQKTMKVLITSITISLLLTSCGGGLNPQLNENLPILLTTDNHVVALAEDGKIWQWKQGKKGKMKDIKKIGLDNVHSIETFGHMGIALKNNGELWTWALINPESKQKEKLKNLRKVDASNTHILYLYADGTVDGYGNEDYYSGFKSLENVVDVAAGRTFSIACTRDGKVYVTGKNTGNCFSGAKGDFIGKPHLIKELEHINRVGVTHFTRYYAVDAFDFLYFWGMSTRNLPPQKLPENTEYLIGDFYTNDAYQIITIHPPNAKGKLRTKIDFEKDENFEDVLYFREPRTYDSYIVVKRDGSVYSYETEISFSGKEGAKIVNKTKVDRLTLDKS